MKVAKKRFHVSLTKPDEAVLMRLSEREGVPAATIASNLLAQALDWHEDEILLNRLNQRRASKDEWVKLDDCLDAFGQ